MWFQAVQERVQQNNWDFQQYQKCLVTLHRGIECPESEKIQGFSIIKPIYRKQQSILTKQAVELISVEYFAVKEKIFFHIMIYPGCFGSCLSCALPRLIRSLLVLGGLMGFTQMEARYLLLTEFDRYLLSRFFGFEWISLLPADPAFLHRTFCTEPSHVSTPASADPN